MGKELYIQALKIVLLFGMIFFVGYVFISGNFIPIGVVVIGIATLAVISVYYIISVWWSNFPTPKWFYPITISCSIILFIILAYVKNIYDNTPRQIIEVISDTERYEHFKIATIPPIGFKELPKTVWDSTEQLYRLTTTLGNFKTEDVGVKETLLKLKCIRLTEIHFNMNKWKVKLKEAEIRKEEAEKKIDNDLDELNKTCK